KMYDLGYSERFMSKVQGAQDQVAMWMASAREVVQRPNAVAFIFEGGIVSEVAQVIDPSLIYRAVQGPSIQVTEYGKGETLLQKNPPGGGKRRFLTADSVSEAEILILLGHIPGNGSEPDKTLFPSPELFEELSLHSRGMNGSGALRIINNLMREVERNPKWKSEGAWRTYLRPNNFGLHAPTHIPADEDFEEVGEMIRRSFPINWQHMPVSEIQIPE
ncbi:hypothetical protein B0H13DRAFT_1515614, partial [Mycena leptocephala]